MRRGTIVVLIFILVAVGIVAASQFLRAQPPMEITVAVSPLAEAWVQDAVTALNATEPMVVATRRVRFNVVPVEDMAVWQDDNRANWTPESHPSAWIPASSMSVNYARDVRFPFETVVDSVARTPLIWGGYASRVSLVTDEGAQPFDWDAVQAAAEAESWQSLGGQSNWGFVKLAFDQPSRSVSGLGVLLSGAAHFAETPTLTPQIAGGQDFRAWFEPVAGSVASFNTLGNDAAAAMASRGASVAEMGLLPESRWLNNLTGLLRNEPMQFAYPEYVFMLDFPLVRWNGDTATNEEREAVTLLANWLMSEAQQEAIVAHGLRPAAGDVPETASLFSAAVPYGVELAPTFGEPVAPLPRSEAQRLLQWFNGVR